MVYTLAVKAEAEDREVAVEVVEAATDHQAEVRPARQIPPSHRGHKRHVYHLTSRMKTQAMLHSMCSCGS